MLTYIPDAAYYRLLDDLREAARTTEWRDAMTELLACADILPEFCRDDAPEISPAIAA